MKYLINQFRNRPTLETAKAVAGFTLIELITAVAVSGTLMALLLPAAQKVR